MKAHLTLACSSFDRKEEGKKIRNLFINFFLKECVSIQFACFGACPSMMSTKLRACDFQDETILQEPLSFSTWKKWKMLIIIVGWPTIVNKAVETILLLTTRLKKDCPKHEIKVVNIFNGQTNKKFSLRVTLFFYFIFFLVKHLIKQETKSKTIELIIWIK